MEYSAPLDGIRALAVLAVLIFHVRPGALPGGFTGVDVFFVLSGFLITSIISHDIRRGSFTLREFYLRRVQRLLPNLIMTVLGVLAIWTWLLPRCGVGQVGRHGVWTLANLSNVYIWRNFGGYWGDTAEQAPLLHTWSLAVEEQFYLVFPGALVLLMRAVRHRVAAWIGAGAAVSFVVCLWGTRAHPVPTFYMMPTRVWELLVGAVLGSHFATRADQPTPGQAIGRTVREMLAWVGFALILGGYFLIDETHGFPGFIALAPTIGTAALIVSIANGETSASRLLACSPVVWVGGLSYSLYLWHWPLIIFGRIRASLSDFDPQIGAVLGGLAGLLIAAAAYYLVEQPLRGRGHGRRLRLVVIGLLFSAGTVASLVALARRVDADPGHRFDRPEFHGLLYSAVAVRENPSPQTVRLQDVYYPPLPVRPDDAWRNGGVKNLYGGNPPRVVVIGSSHALMYSRVIDDICRDMQVSVAFFGADQTPAFFAAQANEHFASVQAAREFDQARHDWLEKWQPRALFVIDRWDLHFGSKAEFNKKLRDFLGEATPLAHKVFFVAQVPVGRWGEQFNLRELMIWQAARVGREVPLPVDGHEVVRRQTVAIAEQAAADFPNLSVLRPDLYFYHPDGSIRWAEGRRFFYADDDHLTDAGSRAVREVFQAAMRDACTAPGCP